MILTVPLIILVLSFRFVLFRSSVFRVRVIYFGTENHLVDIPQLHPSSILLIKDLSFF